MKKNQYFDVQKVRNMRADHSDSYSSFHNVRLVLYIRCSGPVIGLLTATY